MVIQKGTRGELVGAIEMEGRRRRFGFQPYLFHNVAMPNLGPCTVSRYLYVMVPGVILYGRSWHLFYSIWVLVHQLIGKYLRVRFHLRLLYIYIDLGIYAPSPNGVEWKIILATFRSLDYS